MQAYIGSVGEPCAIPRLPAIPFPTHPRIGGRQAHNGKVKDSCRAIFAPMRAAVEFLDAADTAEIALQQAYTKSQLAGFLCACWSVVADVVKFGHGRFFLASDTVEVVKYTIKTCLAGVTAPHQLYTSLVFTKDELARMDDWADTEAAKFTDTAKLKGYSRRSSTRTLTTHEFFKDRAARAVSRSNAGCTKAEIYVVIRDAYYDDPRCRLCGHPLRTDMVRRPNNGNSRLLKPLDPFTLTVDAIVPRANGGLYIPGNIQLLCFACSGLKGKGDMQQAQRTFKAVGADRFVHLNSNLIQVYPPRSRDLVDAATAWARRQLQALNSRCLPGTVGKQKRNVLSAEDLASLILPLMTSPTTYLDVCGAELDLDHASVDRIDSDGDYTRDNVRRGGGQIAAWVRAVRRDHRNARADQSFLLDSHRRPMSTHRIN